ncbi:probable chitinase 10 [Eupeodes corollae]|uniref:probable chitinase 10 n=1 Tax=Eupeodes corollae TaxID=290404 RepID=UPI0024916CD3|nr:probable chitinase 10 [Eupeodes corollae]
MTFLSGAVCLLLLTTLANSSTLRHEPEGREPAFVRSAVESVPQNEPENHSGRYSLRPTFGEIFLPLRSAVESVPTIRSDDTFLGKSFVRASVESAPEFDATLEDLIEEDEEELAEQATPVKPEKLKAATVDDDVEPLPVFPAGDEYAAYVEPSYENDLGPEPYRSGSPYQQLVTAEELQFQREDEARFEQLRRAPATNTNKKNLNRSPQVLCYFTNWAFYRQGDGKFVPENVDGSLCTAVIYSFASLDPDLLTIKEFDPWVDVENGYYKRVTSINVPVLIALGGWTDSTGDKYSRLAADEIKRNVFASSVAGFLQRHGFKGLHLDWNYPKCWQSDCKSGPASDKPNFTKLVKALRTEFNRVDNTLQLGVAISGYQEIIAEAYDLAELSKHANYLTVMSYDYHGAWEQQTGHVSPLYGRKGDKYPQYNTDYAMQLLVRNGAAPEKLIMGIPFYGQTFTLEESSNRLVGEGAPSSGPGEPGELTKQPGMLAYYEICQRIRKNKWQVGRDSERKSGPYAMLRNQWVGYEDTSSVEAKARYAANAGFGGVAAWTIDLDDFQNRCCSEAFPLLKAINRALGRLGSAPPSTGSNCVRPPQPVTPVPPVMTTASSDGGSGNVGSYDSTTSWPSWEASTSTTSAPAHVHPTTSSTTTTTTTTRRPSTTRRTTTYSPAMADATTIPSPAVIQPVMVTSNCVAGQFLPHPNNCNAYFHCVADGEMTQQFCAGGLHWNRENSYCDWPATANCKSVPHTTKGPIQTLNSKPQTTHRRTTALPIQADYPTTPRPAMPSRASRRPTQPPTTSKPSRRPIQSDYQTTAKPVVAAVKPSKPPTAPRPKRPKKCMAGQYWPHRNCGQYYVCVNEVLIPNNCGNDLQWNHEKKICDWPSNVKCVSTKKYLRLINSKASESDPCEGKNFVPYPGDCGKYLRCNWDRLEAAECGPGLHWNPNLDICDWPANANCVQGEIGLDEGNNVIDNGENGLEPLDPLDPSPPSTTTARPVTTPRPTYPTDRPQVQPLDGYYKVVCYFTNWAWYRKGLGRYTPDDINTDLCTHIVYGFAVLDYSELTIRTHDSWADLDNKFYTRVSDLKSKGVKVSLALGGWNDSQGDKYSRLVRNPSARAKFVKQAVDFLERYGFEGLDLDWEYPVCWQTECSKGIADEKEAFTAWVRELSDAFKPKGLLLSTAVSPSKKIIDAGYDVADLARYFDWIAVMTYDFHGQWDKKTGHVAPLYYHPEDDYDYFNANFSLNYWIEKGAPSRKIVMGMPLYGQSFTLADPKDNGLNAKAPGPGLAGEFTRAAGFLAYYEICDRVKNQGWEVVQDEKGRMGPYARKGNQWVSFDDPAMIRKKSQLVRALNLGGGMVWALDLDDFKNRCGDGVHPLLTQIHDVLKTSPSGYEPTPGLINLDEPEVPAEPAQPVEHNEGGKPPSNMETIEEIQSNEEVPANIETIDNVDNELPYDPNSEVDQGEEEGSYEISSDSDMDFKVVCYFTNWAWYRQGGGKFVPEDIDAELCTHIVYGFAVLNRETLTIQPHDSWADMDNKFYERVTTFKAKKVKVTVAIGGWNDSAGDKYARLVKDARARARFIKHVVEFIEKYNFDGLDLDWEYPVCWQVDCNKGSMDEKEGFAALVREISEEFKPRGLLLSSAVSPNKKVIDAGYDVPVLSKYFDWIAVMTYDFHGQWDKKTGHVAPMYGHPDDDPTFNANFSISYWINQGADRRKIIMGMPMYGQSFSLAQANGHDLNAPTYGGGEAGEATRARGFLSYYEICNNIRNKNWHVVRDPRGRMGPYAYLRDQWVSFDDVPMIRHKSEYVKAMGLGGAMIWALDLDDFKNKCDCESYPLLKTINRVLRKYPGPQPQCKLEDKSEIANLSSDTDRYVAPSVEVTTKQTPVIVRETSLKPVVYTEPEELEESAEEQENFENSESEDMSCHGRNFVAHKRDCNKYYVCQFGGLIEQRCPDGLHWNENYCDWPQNSQCSVTDSRTTTTVRPKPVTKPTKKPVLATTKKPTSTPTKKPDKKRPPIKPSADEQYKVVCYFTNWAWYRPGEGKFVPEDIDENLCTHIVYGFAVLNRDSLTIKTHDSWADVDNKFYERVVAYKEKGIRVTVAIGGWNDSLGNKYSRLVLDPQARARFIKSVLDFVDKYGFEGLDLDWEYPVCWQVDCDKGSPEEKAGFAALVRELSEEFKPRGLLLSSAVSPSKKVIDAGYDVPTLARYFDWIAVMTYDFHGHWDKKTGHVAPLYYVEGDSYDYFNANFSMNYWIEKGTPPKKLVMGMPLYGQSFSLADSSSRGLNEKTYGPGEAGKFTRAGGFLAYYEICENVNSGGWTVVRDDEGRIGPYAYRGNQWVSYDDVAEIRRKSQFVKDLGLGGGMVWALDLDDFRGRCGCGKHPLLRTMNQELRGIPGQRANDCT